MLGQISLCFYVFNCELKSDTSGMISFDNSSTTTTEEDNFRDPLFKASSSKCFTIGSFLLRGDVRIHRKTEGTTPFFSSFFPERDFCISPSLKCREQTLVLLVTLKYCPSSLLIACSHFFIGFSIGNLKNDTFVPSSSRYPFFVHSGTQQ